MGLAHSEDRTSRNYARLIVRTSEQGAKEIPSFQGGNYRRPPEADRGNIYKIKNTFNAKEHD